MQFLLIQANLKFWKVVVMFSFYVIHDSRAFHLQFLKQILIANKVSEYVHEEDLIICTIGKLLLECNVT